ncbi:hypothetical protein NC652_033930 [Populus alba x Populus x berolinensis]|nr:hypothetical protein NC652_033930 [Populus alba x Populus x berolinensis]
MLLVGCVSSLLKLAGITIRVLNLLDLVGSSYLSSLLLQGVLFVSFAMLLFSSWWKELSAVSSSAFPHSCLQQRSLMEQGYCMSCVLGKSFRLLVIGCATPPCWSCWAHCSSADGLVCVVGLFPVAGVVALSGAALLNVVCYALYSWLLEFMLAFASLVATICRSAEDRLFGGAGVLLLLLRHCLFCMAAVAGRSLHWCP